MSRRTQSLPPNFVEKQRRSRCTAAICFSWKVFTCVLSHVTLVSLVVAYCIGGALLFQHLEQENEMEVKRAAKRVRENITDTLWLLSEAEDYFHEDNWTLKAEENLKVFEEQILTLMKTRGWDGEDGDTHTQWTFFGALFYSIIVITTIGYGHIAPRTSWGKVTTIFYAILGIPLMLLCLSNIGDVLATSFRFLYWRICCFVCTREPKKSRRHRSSARSSFRQSQRFSSRSQPPPVMRRSIRTSQRSADSGFATAYEPGMIHAYSDPELRFNAFEAEVQHKRERDFYKEYELDERDRNFNNRNSRFSNRIKNRDRDRLRDRHTVDRERYSRRRSADIIDELEVPAKRTPSTRSFRTSSVTRDLNRVRSQTLPVRPQPKSPKTRSKSVDPRTMQYDDLIDEADCKAPIYCNKYAIDDLDRRESSGNHNRRGSVPKSHGSVQTRQQQQYAAQPLPPQSRYGNRLELPGFDNPRLSRFDDYDDDDEDEDSFEIPMRDRRAYVPPARRERIPPPPSPRIMSPMGFAVHRQARLTIPDDDSFFDDDVDIYGEISPRNRPVPIWLCVFLVISYIIAGAFLFSEWEKWTFLDSAYFCFITLTTIGFGDFVPAQGVKDNSKESIALCSLYLLFGISLLAMSFNLVQEEVIANVKDVARRLGILKEEEIDE